ncbi:MAG: PhoX family phosphatase [Burkholderiaceae bacterium]
MKPVDSHRADAAPPPTDGRALPAGGPSAADLACDPGRRHALAMLLPAAPILPVFAAGSAPASRASPHAVAASPAARHTFIDFAPVGPHTDATVHVPDGYRWQVVVGSGDRIHGATAGGANPAGAGDALRFGQNCDGMALFEHRGHQLLAVNNEFASGAGVPPGTRSAIRDAQQAQGISIIEIIERAQGWQPVMNSPFNRRVTHTSPIRLLGPAAGHALLRTDADPEGRTSLGALATCGCGRTPWGTYLSCEENFQAYFGASGGLPAAASSLIARGRSRYGLVAHGGQGSYHQGDPRFDLSRHPNEAHRAGWVIEIDPARPDAIPLKHTGLGRFKHENAEVVLARDGRVVVYMGDDERGEFIYRFVSHGVYVHAGDTAGLLDEGTLFVARFNDDHSGRWLALTPQSTGMADIAEIAIFTRLAGSAVGATTMDRPEWIAVHPDTAEVYCSLTHNPARGHGHNAGGDPMPVNGPNPRPLNRYGQILRWRPADGDHAAIDFDWDLFAVAGNPAVHHDHRAGSANIHAGNLFNSPDGLSFDRRGRLWIRTDGNDSNQGDFAGMGNNQMLVGDPLSGAIARFMTGPKGCEITGHCWSADRRTMFAGIQHPAARWPDGQAPGRSAVIAIKREDNGLMG